MYAAPRLGRDQSLRRQHAEQVRGHAPPVALSRRLRGSPTRRTTSAADRTPAWPSRGTSASTYRMPATRSGTLLATAVTTIPPKLPPTSTARDSSSNSSAAVDVRDERRHADRRIAQVSPFAEAGQRRREHAVAAAAQFVRDPTPLPTAAPGAMDDHDLGHVREPSARTTCGAPRQRGTTGRDQAGANSTSSSPSVSPSDVTRIRPTPGA